MCLSLALSLPVSPYPHLCFPRCQSLLSLVSLSSIAPLFCLVHRPAFSPSARTSSRFSPPPSCKIGAQFSCPAETDQCLPDPTLNAKGNLILCGSRVHSRSDQLRPRAEPPRMAAAQKTWALLPDSPPLQHLEPTSLGASQLNSLQCSFSVCKMRIMKATPWCYLTGCAEYHT